MRVEIGSELENRIRQVCRQAGFSRKGDLVREATRVRVNELEAEYLTQEQSVRDAFTVTVNRGSVGGPEIRLEPRRGSSIRFEYFAKGDPPHTTILDTGNTYIPEKTPADSDFPGIKDTLEQIDGIDRADVLTKGAITVTVTEDNSIPIVGTEDQNTIVDLIYDELGRLIEDANQRVRDGKETREDAMRRAVKDYWDYAHQIGKQR